MGAAPSGIEEDVRSEEVAEGSVPSTPILTPRIKTVRDLDPRSPSNNVVRTPIEMILMKRNKSNLDVPLSVVECTPKLKYLNVDPRSPTIDFNRTPIVVLEDENDSNILESPKVIERNVSDNIKTNLVDDTEVNSVDNIERNMISGVARNIPDDIKRNVVDDIERSVIDNRERIVLKNTDRNAIDDTDRNVIDDTERNRVNKLEKNKADEKECNVIENLNKRKSYVLLETNLDYIETDIDAVYLKNSPQRLSMENRSLIKGNGKCDKGKGKDEIGNLEKQIENINLNVEETEAVFAENVERSTDKDKKIVKVEKDPPTNLEEIPDEQLLNVKMPQVAEYTNDLTIVMNNVKDFDKKLTNLIYEDTDLPVVKKDEGSQVRYRLPLATRNENAVTKKKLPKLKVMDKPKKYNEQFSRIPVSKQGKKGRIVVQCENTPPRNSRERKMKTKRSEWDNDKTLII